MKEIMKEVVVPLQAECGKEDCRQEYKGVSDYFRKFIMLGCVHKSVWLDVE